jgi:plasmid replication initiation protein
MGRKVIYLTNRGVIELLYMRRESERKELLKVREHNIFIEGVNRLSKAEQILWFFALTKTKFFKYGDPDRELTEEEIEELKKRGEYFTAYTYIDLSELKERFPEYFASNDIAYYRKVLKKMEGKAVFAVKAEQYIRLMEELGCGYMVKGIKRLEEREGISYFGLSVISSVILTKRGNMAIIFSPQVAPILLELKKYYTIYDFENVLKLERKYSRILYRLFKEKYNLGKTVFRIGLGELMNILDASDKNYRVFVFNYKVLKPAIEEINQKTNLRVEYRTIRKGRGGKTVAYEFRVKEIPYPPTMEEIIDVEKLKALLSLIPIEAVRRKSEFDVDNVEIEEEAIKRFKVEIIAQELLKLERINPAVALWYLLHFPKEKQGEIWEEIRGLDVDKKVKNASGLLISKIENRKEELNFLIDGRMEKTIKEVLKEITKPYEEYLEEKRKREEIERLLNEIKQIWQGLTKTEKIEAKKKVLEAFGRKEGKLGEVIKELAEKGDLNSLKAVKEIFEGVKKEDEFLLFDEI